MELAYGVELGWDVELDCHEPTEPGFYVYLNYQEDPDLGTVHRIGPCEEPGAQQMNTISVALKGEVEPRYIIPMSSIRYILNVKEEHKNED